LAWLSRYREYLGLAFQIADDILDSHGGELSTAAEWSHQEPKQAIHRLLESS
jgi:geranylgeranyl pyrophosphate synthase